MVRKFLTIAVLVLFTGFVFQNCDNVKISVVDKPPTFSSFGVRNLCTAPPAPAGVQTRVLFMIDMSASNKIGNPGSGVPTDPDKLYRYGSMKTFVDSHIGNGDISYGMIAFNGTTATALINDGSISNPIFSNDSTVVYKALTQFMATADTGETPYKAALQLATVAISNDKRIQDAAGVRTIYSLVMISDGYPTDYGTPINDTQLSTDLQTLLAISSRIRLSTIYYGPQATQDDLNAATRLQNMARQGGGNFLDTNLQGRDISVDQVIAYDGTEPWAIKQFMVINLNAGVCDNGKIGTDSDADGLCDDDEAAYNKLAESDSVWAAKLKGARFNATKRNSFGNAYNDYVNFRALKYGESLDTNCSGTTRTGVDLLNDCEKLFVHSQSPMGPTPAWTASMATNFTADRYNYDSDGDGFLDFVEFTFGRSISSALDYNSTTKMVGNYSMRDILLQHRHPLRPEGGTPYDPNFKFVSLNQWGGSCYSYDQDIIPLYNTQELKVADTPGSPELAHKTGQNVFLVYYIATPESDPYGVGELHYRYVYIDFNSHPTADVFINGTFLTYTPTNAIVKKTSH